MNKKKGKNRDLGERLNSDPELVRKLKVKFLGYFGREANVDAFRIEDFFIKNHYATSLDEARRVSLKLGGKAFHYEGFIGNTLEFLPNEKNGNLNYNIYAFDSSHRNH